MEVQKTIQKHIDNAISKTIHIPNDYNKEELKTLWLEYLPYLKGTTFYREGSRGFIDKEGNTLEPPLVPIKREDAIKLFNEQERVNIKTEITDCPKGVCEI
jgi:hypothetical protein